MRALLLVLALTLSNAFSFKVTCLHKFSRVSPLRLSKETDAEDIRQALENARKCAASGLSPGAGLATADEQSDAAYADLINTSVDQRNISLTDEDLELLERGGKMWESGSKEKQQRGGILGDLFNVISALSGGAHIAKNKFGET